MVQTASQEFHGASIFENNIDVSVTGSFAGSNPYILFDGVQLQTSQAENMYLDQMNETLICAANCYFNHAWKTSCPQGKSCGAIEVGPNAKNKAIVRRPDSEGRAEVAPDAPSGRMATRDSS